VREGSRDGRCRRIGGDCLCDGGAGDGDTKQYVATFGHTYTFTPTFLMDWTLGYTKMNQNVLGPDFGTNFGSDVWGIPGTNGTRDFESGWPRFAHTWTSSSMKCWSWTRTRLCAPIAWRCWQRWRGPSGTPRICRDYRAERADP